MSVALSAKGAGKLRPTPSSWWRILGPIPDYRPYPRLLMPDRSIRLIPILLEAFFVVLGVFLALAANEWREDRNARERADIAAASIVEELAANHTLVQQSVAHHRAALDTLYRYYPTGGPPLPREAFQRGLFRPAPLLSTAWDAARAAGVVSHMDYDDVLRYARLYAMQEAYQAQSERIGNLMYEEMMDVGFDGLAQNYRNFTSVLTGFSYFERTLGGAYSGALAAPDSSASERSAAGGATAG